MILKKLAVIMIRPDLKVLPGRREARKASRSAYKENYGDVEKVLVMKYSGE